MTPIRLASFAAAIILGAALATGMVDRSAYAQSAAKPTGIQK